MSKPAFFVDGQTEQRSLHKLCPGNPIRTIGCNGSKVSISSIAKRLVTHIKLLNNKYYPIIVLIDREGREESVEIIKTQLQDELKCLKVQDNVIIGVCDRMIENWILADTDNFLNHINRTKKLDEDCFEGLPGKSVLKKYFKEYHETTDGVSLLTSSNPKILFERSASFKNFAITLRKIKCYWLESLNEI